MSLINKMLQDLEERRSGTEVLGPLHGQVRAAPEPRSRGMSPWIVLSLIGLTSAALGGAIWWKRGLQEENPVLPSTQPIAPAPSLNLKLDHVLPQLPDRATVESILPANNTDVAVEHARQGKAAYALDEHGALKGQESANAMPALAVQSLDSSAKQQATKQQGLPAESKSSVAAARIADASPRMKRAVDSTQTQADAATSDMDVRSRPALKNKMQTAEAPESMGEAEALPVKLSKQLKELTPSQRAENEYRRALNLIEQGKSREAISTLEQALQIDSRHVPARQTLAALLIDGKRPDEALRKLSEGLIVDRSQIGLAMMLARLQVDRQETRNAIETLQLSLPYAMERADYRAFMAALSQREARHKEAIDHYLAALKKAPNNGIWWMGIGISLQAENRLPEARDAYTRAKMSGSLSPELQAFVEQKLGQVR